MLKANKYLVFVFLALVFLSLQVKDKAYKRPFNLSGSVINKKNKSIDAVKLRLIKDKVTIDSTLSDESGKFKFSFNINTLDSASSVYLISFTKDSLVSKAILLNTFLKNPTSNSYQFKLDVVMKPIVGIDSSDGNPTATIAWDDRKNKFAFKPEYINYYNKKLPKTDTIPSNNPSVKNDTTLLNKSAVEEAKAFEEELLKEIEIARLEEEKKKREYELAQQLKQKQEEEELALKRKNELLRNEAVKKTQEAVAKYKLDSAKSAISSTSVIAKTVKPPVSKTPIINNTNTSVAYMLQEYQSDDFSKSIYEISKTEEELLIREIYSIRDIKLLRAKQQQTLKETLRKKYKNMHSKYDTENPLTSLLDNVDAYEKALKKHKK